MHRSAARYWTPLTPLLPRKGRYITPPDARRARGHTRRRYQGCVATQRRFSSQVRSTRVVLLGTRTSSTRGAGRCVRVADGGGTAARRAQGRVCALCGLNLESCAHAYTGARPPRARWHAPTGPAARQGGPVCACGRGARSGRRRAVVHEQLSSMCEFLASPAGTRVKPAPRPARRHDSRDLRA